MKKTTWLIAGLLTTFTLGFYVNSIIANQAEMKAKNYQMNEPMRLGAFSISLNVKDLKTSKEFYENMGFTILGGDIRQNYLIMKNENAIIGLFQGMFEGNILTFNPGWDENAKNTEKFDDVRIIQKQLKNKGIKLSSEADEKTTGPAFIILNDPDGNTIYIDQHR